MRGDSGRHRLGRPGLWHCRDHDQVLAALVRGDLHRHAAAESRRRPGPAVTALVVTVATSALIAAGWLATGASAVAALLGD